MFDLILHRLLLYIKGDNRQDSKEIKKEFGNRRPDRVMILKHKTELTEEETYSQQMNILFPPTVLDSADWWATLLAMRT